jgi:SAM-dependent methyltransferase
MGRIASRNTASRRFAPAHDEPQLPLAERRARGVYYTPPEIVRRLVELTLMGTRSVSEGVPRGPLRVLDPACGAGAMLLAAQAQQHGKCQVRLYGIDSNPQAVAAARAALPQADIWLGDALFDERLARLAPFDAIVGNPPYVSIRELARSAPPEAVARLRQRYQTARGNFDLYVPFVERAMSLLSSGGRCGLVLPNKWATLDYARPLRELLLSETTLEHVVDLSAERVFAAASVYPHLLVFAKQRPARSHAVRHCLGSTETRRPQRLLSAAAISFAMGLEVESRVKTAPLGELATISCGTPGYSARRVSAALRNAAEGVPYGAHAASFITSGNIDRYRVTPGNVRFLGRTYERPILPLDSPTLTARQRQLFSQPKIVVAGLSQRLEAAWDDRGLALGVQVFALSNCQIDPQVLLALLNSKLLSYLFRTRFAAKRLAGGYMAINKGQLARLPIAIPRRTSVPLVPMHGQAGRSPYDDVQVDAAVYQLYRLTKAEIATVESHFANLGRRAA